MKKLKLLLCILLTIALISPNITFISKAENTTTREVKEVDITWEENETEMIGTFDIGQIYENNDKVYIGGKEAIYETLDFLLNDNELNNLKVESREGYYMSSISNKVRTSGDNKIVFSKDVYEQDKLRNLKILVEKETTEEIENNTTDPEEDKSDNTQIESIEEGKEDGAQVVNKEISTLSEVNLGEDEYWEVTEVDVSWSYDGYGSNKHTGTFKLPSQYNESSSIYLGGNVSQGTKEELMVNGVPQDNVSFELAGSRLDETKQKYYIIDIKDTLDNKKVGDSITIKVNGSWNNNPLSRAKIYVTNVKSTRSNYIPKIDTSGAVTTTNENSDTYPLILDWKKTKTTTKNGYEVGTKQENFIKNSAGRYVLPDNTTGVIQPLQTQDIIKYSNDTYSNYYLDYRSLLSYIEPTQTVNWKTDNGIKLDGWKHTTTNSNKTSWRMYRGVFKLTDEQITDIRNGDAQLFLGIDGGNNPATILGINDYLSVLVNGQQTNINVSTSTDGKLNLITYDSDEENANENYQSKTLLKEKNKNYTGGAGDYYCNEPGHDIGTSSINNNKTIDGWHLHLNDLGTTDSIGNTALLGDISSLVVNKDTTSSKVHRLEMLTGEFADTGGVTKLEVYYVKKPKISATKSAFTVENNTEVEVSNNQAITPGEEVYFKLGMENKGKTNITEDIHFVDYNADLGISVYIDSTGVYTTNEKLEKGTLLYSLDNIIVKKYQKNNSEQWVEIESDKSNSDKLLTLDKNQKIEIQSDRSKNVENRFMYVVKGSDVGKSITNTVKVGCKYMGKELNATANADITMNIVDAKVNTTKTIVKVNNNNPQLVDDKVITSPGDKVTFEITLQNIKDKIAQGLSLDDVLKLNGTDVSGITWKFYRDENCTEEVNNLNNLEIPANEKLTLYTNYTIPSDTEHDSQYKNTINLYQTKVGATDKTLISTSEVDFKVVSNGSLKFKKEVDNNSLQQDDQEFTVNIKGSDNTQYNLRLKRGEEVELSGLKYGVTYTITESVVPMNYEFTDITFGASGTDVSISNKKLQVTLSNSTDGKLVTIKNKKINDKGLFDQGYIKNTFKYFQNIISGGDN